MSQNPPGSGLRHRIELLCEEAPDDLLLMSRDDCHATRVSSIVVGRSESGGLRRMFLAWPGHRLAENHLVGALPVGIHDHRYPLRLQLLAGRVRNTVYRRGGARSARILREFEFRSGQMQVTPSASFVGLSAITVVAQEWLPAGEWLSLRARDLHNVECAGPAAWLVEEGPVEQESTRLFTPRMKVDTRDLYRPFESAAAVRDHAARFVSVLEQQGVDLSYLAQLAKQSREASRAMCEAAQAMLPIGTVLEATLGRSRVRGEVIGHAEGSSAYYAGSVAVRNLKTGKIRRVTPHDEDQEVTVISLPQTTALTSHE